MNTNAPSISPQDSSLPLSQSNSGSGQLPGVKQVLMNSLRINKKLHGQIVAREHSVRSQAQQASIKLNSLYRQMEEMYIKTQQLYEETVRQNQKTRYMAEELLRPFRQELKGKVDQTTLSLKMKMMLSQFDNLGHKISYDRDGKPLEHNDSYTFRFVKAELLPIISSLQYQLKEKSEKISCQQQELNCVHKQQSHFSQELLRANEAMRELKTSLLNEISNNFSEQAWQSRLNTFYEAFIRTSITPLAHSLTNNHRQTLSDIEQLKNDFNTFKKGFPDPKIGEVSRKIEELKIQLACTNKLAGNSEAAVTQLRKGMEETKLFLRDQISKSSQNSIREQISTFQEENKNIRNEIQQLRAHLSSQSETLTQGNGKAISLRVNRLDSQIKVLSQHLKNVLKQVQGQQRQISFVKELLSQKANFSDIIVHTQNKADKQDYRELKHLIQVSGSVSPLLEPPTDELDSCMVTQDQPRDAHTPTPNRFRRRQSTSRRGQQQSTSPFLPDSQRDESVKRYMLGLRNGSNNYTRQNLVKEKGRFLFLNQTERRQPKTGRCGETFTENFV